MRARRMMPARRRNISARLREWTAPARFRVSKTGGGGGLDFSIFSRGLYSINDEDTDCGGIGNKEGWGFDRQEIWLPVLWGMKIQLSGEQEAELLDSIQRVISEELEMEASDMQARVMLKYVCEEIAPFAYNKGVADAKRFMLQASEDLDGSCFEQGLSYWKKSDGGAKAVRRKL